MGAGSAKYSAVSTTDVPEARVKAALQTRVPKLWGGTVLNMLSVFFLFVAFLLGELEAIEYFTLGPIWLMYLNSFFTTLVFIMTMASSYHLKTGGPPINGYPLLRVYDLGHVQRIFVTQLVCLLVMVYVVLRQYAFYVNFKGYIDDFDDYITENASIPDVMMHARFGDIQIATALGFIAVTCLTINNAMMDAHPDLSPAMQLIRHRQLFDLNGTTLSDTDLEKRLTGLSNTSPLSSIDK